MDRYAWLRHWRAPSDRTRRDAVHLILPYHGQKGKEGITGIGRHASLRISVRLIFVFRVTHRFKPSVWKFSFFLYKHWLTCRKKYHNWFPCYALPHGHSSLLLIQDNCNCFLARSMIINFVHWSKIPRTRKGFFSLETWSHIIHLMTNFKI